MDDLAASITPTVRKPDTDPLLTYALIAKLANVKIGTVYMWRKRGIMPAPAPETTGRRPVWRKSVIEKFLESTLRREDDITL